MEDISKNPDIEIRTMKSDIESIKSSGGDVTSAQFVRMPGEKQASIEELKETDLGAIPGYKGPEQAIFADASPAVGQETIGKSSFLKIIILSVMIIALVIGVGFLAYYAASKILK